MQYWDSLLSLIPMTGVPHMEAWRTPQQTTKSHLIGSWGDYHEECDLRQLRAETTLTFFPFNFILHINSSAPEFFVQHTDTHCVKGMQKQILRLYAEQRGHTFLIGVQASVGCLAPWHKLYSSRTVPKHSVSSKGAHFEECKTWKTTSFTMPNSFFSFLFCQQNLIKKIILEINFILPLEKRRKKLRTKEKNHFPI